MDWHPFKLLNASECAALARAVQRVAADWQAAWLPPLSPQPPEPPALPQVHGHDTSDRAATPLAAEPQRWLGCSHHGATLSFALTPTLATRLADGLLGSPAHSPQHSPPPSPPLSPLTGDLVNAALADLGQRLLGAQGDGGAGTGPAPSALPPAPACWRRGSGAAIVVLDMADVGVLALVASPGWVTAQLAARPRLAPAPRAALADRRQCIGQGRVQLQAWAGGVTLELGLLQTLAVGDVLRLDARIDQPLRITVQGLDSGRRAYLGSSEGRRALQAAATR